jgi:hypothetical protein
VLKNCNRCGACCYADGYKCVNLITAPDGRTNCAVWPWRVPGMPIIMTKPGGKWIEGICNHTLPIEEKILTGLMEQGVCSMEVDNG